MDNTLKIGIWNANTIGNKKQELTLFMEEQGIDVMLLTETNLKKRNGLKIRNYTTYRTDRPTGTGGGTAILVKTGIKHGELPRRGTTHIEETGIRITGKHGKFNLYTVYKPPNKPMEEADIKKLFSEDLPTIIAGDLNAKHTEWGCRATNKQGRQLRKITDDNQLTIIAPDEPTHTHPKTQTTDILDIAILKEVPWNYEISTIPDLSSDHCPVILEIEVEGTRTESQKKITDWTQLKKVMETKTIKIESKTEIETAVEDLQRRIHKAIEKATRTIQIKKKNQVPSHVKRLLDEKRRAKKQYQRTFHPQDKAKLNKLTKEVREEVKNLFNNDWEQRLENMDTEHENLWKMSKALRGKKQTTKIPHLKTGNKTAITDQEKADLFADIIEEQFTTNPDNGNQEFNHNVDEIGRTTAIEEGDEEIDEITKEEIQGIIKYLKDKKAPGIDEISNKTLKNLPEEVYEEIAEIGRGIMKTGHFPNHWKKAITIMIPKPGKPRNAPTSYRPISLLPAISKVIERAIHGRLKTITETKKIIPDHQFGFRTKHCCTYQLARLTEDIKSGMNLSKPTGAIFLDIEKAFDRVWHQGLIYKMKKAHYPGKLINVIKSYLEERRFVIKIDTEKSDERKVQAGVPQGSILGPLLYNIYTADMPKMDRAKIAQFADDTAIYSTERQKDRVTNRLQENVNRISEYFKAWRIKINPNKTTGVYFNYRKRRIDARPEEIKIEDQKIEWKKEATYLGIILDEDLNFNQQIDNNIKKTRQLHGYLYPMLNKKSKLSTENKMRLIKTIIIPSITYGGEIWYLTDSSRKKKLQSSINKVTRTAIGAPWYMTNEQIRTEMELPTIEELINEKSKRLIHKMTTHENIEVNQTTQKRQLGINERRKTLSQQKRKLNIPDEGPTPKKRNTRP